MQIIYNLYIVRNTTVSCELLGYTLSYVQFHVLDSVLMHTVNMYAMIQEMLVCFCIIIVKIYTNVVILYLYCTGPISMHAYYV